MSEMMIRIYVKRNHTESTNNRKLDKNIDLRSGVKGIRRVALIDGKTICFL